jgi:Cu+-exporting ATPase
VEGIPLLVGSEALLKERGVETVAMQEAAIRLASEGRTLMFVAGRGKLLGLIGIADPIKGRLSRGSSQPEADGNRGCSRHRR